MKPLHAKNTYPYRETIRARGGKWDPKSKIWSVPEDVHAELMTLCRGTDKPLSNAQKARIYDNVMNEGYSDRGNFNPYSRNDYDHDDHHHTYFDPRD